MDDQVKALSEGFAALLRAAEHLRGIDELKAYRYDDVAEFLGMKRASVKSIPKAELLAFGTAPCSALILWLFGEKSPTMRRRPTRRPAGSACYVISSASLTRG